MKYLITHFSKSVEKDDSSGFFSFCKELQPFRWILGNNAFVFASSLNALTITNCFEEIWSDTVLSRVNRGLLFRHNQGTVRFSRRRTRLSILGKKAKLYINKSLSLHCTHLLFMKQTFSPLSSLPHLRWWFSVHSFDQKAEVEAVGVAPPGAGLTWSAGPSTWLTLEMGVVRAADVPQEL